jgi:beta-glucosidase/6-phospho-beta-glucosidase/beta-galactosidase
MTISHEKKSNQFRALMYIPGKGLNIWDVYTTNSSVVLDGSTGQTACNSYYFYQKDVDALKSLGVNEFIHFDLLL